MFKKVLLSSGMFLTLVFGFRQLALAEYIDQCDMPACPQLWLCEIYYEPSGTCYVGSNLKYVHPTSCGPCYMP